MSLKINVSFHIHFFFIFTSSTTAFLDTFQAFKIILVQICSLSDNYLFFQNYFPFIYVMSINDKCQYMIVAFIFFSEQTKCESQVWVDITLSEKHTYRIRHQAVFIFHDTFLDIPSPFPSLSICFCSAQYVIRCAKDR